MILPLRQRHRRIFSVLGVLLPVALLFGVVARKVVPPTEALPPELLLQTQTFAVTEYERDDLFEKVGVKVRLWQDLKSSQYAVSFTAPMGFIKADLIAYWLVGKPSVSDELPADAILLGSFAATVPLPSETAEREGVLILYSLADQEIVDVSKPVRFADSKR